MDLAGLLEKAVPIVQKAGALVRGLPHPAVYSKEGHANFVTEADMASQAFLLRGLSSLLPQAHFFAEEQEENELAPGFNWIIDPIDGTTNFIRGYRPSAISVGLVEDGCPALGLVLYIHSGELFTAARGQGAFLNGKPLARPQVPVENALIAWGTAPYYRELLDLTFAVGREALERFGDLRRCGSAALDLCYVAAGRCDGFFEAALSPWDYAGAAAILGEAGCLIGTAPGKALTFDRKQLILAGSPAVYAALGEIVARCLPSP